MITSFSNSHRRFAPLIAWLFLLNAPFLLGHPDGEAIPRFVRSLAIIMALVVTPGAACLFPWRQRWPWWLWLPAVILLSTLVFVGALVTCQLLHYPLSGHRIWNGTWIATNLLMLLSLALFPIGKDSKRMTLLQGNSGKSPFASYQSFGLVLCALLVYGVYYIGATRVVPPQEDHDLEVQGTGYALLDRMEPMLLTDRGTDFYFAHPPLLHVWVSGSFLYHDKVEHLRTFDEATRRNLAARRGAAFDPPADLPDGLQVTGVTGSVYLVASPEGVFRVSVERFELELITAHYLTAPHLLETRAPSIFFAALTVALLAEWSSRLGGNGWIGVAAAVAYATNPEVFVRSCYGGYFAISNFAVLLMLAAAAEWDSSPRRRQWSACVLTGVLAALANHKLVLLPVAVGLYSLLAGRNDPKTLVRVRMHPLLVGFAAGTSLFWVYGLSVNAAGFWNEHVRTHFVDRIAQINPLGYTGYPSVAELWLELCGHTGYVLLPLGLSGMLLLGRRRVADGGTMLPATARAWFVWVVLTGIAFSIVDWRMTKHLMPLLIPLHLALVGWAAVGRGRRMMVLCMFVLLIAWNLVQVARIAADFESFHVTPAW